MTFEPSKSKGDALRRLSDLLGYEFDLSIGSTVPSALFTAATRRAGVSDEGSMPVRGERVVRAAGLTWDEKCDSRNAPSGGGSTVTLTGLNRLLEALQALGVRAPEMGQVDAITLGSEYRLAVGGVVAEPVELVREWDALDRATRAHQNLQNSLASYVEELGVEPRSPKQQEPAFDLAWEFEGSLVVVEVKSVLDANRRQQVRLGVGQVLEYVALLNDAAPGDYRPVLLLEQPPDPVDYLLAASTGVVVIGPDQFNELGLENLLPLGAS